MSKRFNYGKFIGSVSHGTMREEDLIPAFVELAEAIAAEFKATGEREVAERIAAQLSGIKERMEAEDYYDSEDASFDLNEDLFNVLNDYAPPYFYFGSHPGDGCDYGYWLSEEWREQAQESALIVDDTADVPRDYCGEVFHVNDHGNVTLYSAFKGKLAEVWAVV